MVDTGRRLEIRAYWAALSPEEQRAFGEAALIAILAEQHIDIAALPELVATRWRHAGDTMWIRAHRRRPLLADYPEGPDLAALGIRTCRVCGCTDESACDGGCSWIGDDLCSACAPPAAWT